MINEPVAEDLGNRGNLNESSYDEEPRKTSPAEAEDGLHQEPADDVWICDNCDTHNPLFVKKCDTCMRVLVIPATDS